MRTVSIPDTKLEVSCLCLGGASLIAEHDDEHVFSLLDEYVKLGGNFVDSANVYGKWLPEKRNSGDQNIGKWLKQSGLRGRMIIATKGAHPELGNILCPRFGRDDMERDLDESLRALDCGQIDLYYLHRDDPKLPVERIVDDVNRFVRDGRVRYLGVSNWAPARIAAANVYARASGQSGFAANELLFGYAKPDMSRHSDPLLRAMDAETDAFHRESGLAAVGYESQGHGYFQKRALDPNAKVGAIYEGEENMERLRRAEALAKRKGIKIGDAALGYVLNRPYPSVAIIGCSSLAQLRDSMTAADVTLSPEDVAFLEG